MKRNTIEKLLTICDKLFDLSNRTGLAIALTTHPDLYLTEIVIRKDDMYGGSDTSLVGYYAVNTLEFFIMFNQHNKTGDSVTTSPIDYKTATKWIDANSSRRDSYGFDYKIH